MMYKDKLAIAIKNNGKILREFQDQVFVPFGSEYSILVKNLNSRRAVVKISIDGQPVNDDGFVVYANSSIDIERFIKEGNLNKGNRFKFIERTRKIEDGPRGIQVEDGLIRVEFQFEKALPKIEEIVHHHRHVWHDWGYYPPYRPWYWHDRYYCGSPIYGNGLIGQSTGATGSLASSDAIPMNASYSAAAASVSSDAIPMKSSSMRAVKKGDDTVNAQSTFNDAGITVPGSVSEQKFVTVDDFPLDEETHVMVIKLLGESKDGKKVTAPITVKTKQECPTCGHKNKATAKFCAECGTGLEVV